MDRRSLGPRSLARRLIKTPALLADLTTIPSRESSSLDGDLSLVLHRQRVSCQRLGALRKLQMSAMGRSQTFGLDVRKGWKADIRCTSMAEG
jgi:hypothetical protein